MYLHTLVHETCYFNVLAVSIKNSLDALGHEPAMLRRWLESYTCLILVAVIDLY